MRVQFPAGFFSVLALVPVIEKLVYSFDTEKSVGIRQRSGMTLTLTGVFLSLASSLLATPPQAL
jgi:hypothetical protein